MGVVLWRWYGCAAAADVKEHRRRRPVWQARAPIRASRCEYTAAGADERSSAAERGVWERRIDMRCVCGTRKGGPIRGVGGEPEREGKV